MKVTVNFTGHLQNIGSVRTYTHPMPQEVVSIHVPVRTTGSHRIHIREIGKQKLRLWPKVIQKDTKRGPLCTSGTSRYYII